MWIIWDNDYKFATISNYLCKQTVIEWDTHELGNPVVRSLFGSAVGYS